MQRFLKRTRLTAALIVAMAVPSPSARAEEQRRAPLRDDRHEVEIYIPSWKELRQRNIVMQTRDYSCGAAALATVLRYYWGDSVGEEAIIQTLFKTLTPEEQQDRVKNGLAISDLRKAAVDMGYLSTIGTISLEQLSQARAPVVVALKIKEYHHFVVYRGMCDGRVYLADPSPRQRAADDPRVQWAVAEERDSRRRQTEHDAAAAIGAERPRRRGPRGRHERGNAPQTVAGAVPAPRVVKGGEGREPGGKPVRGMVEFRAVPWSIMREIFPQKGPCPCLLVSVRNAYLDSSCRLFWRRAFPPPRPGSPPRDR